MPRKLSGEGSIRMRPDGRWEARWSTEDGEGRRTRHSLYADTAEEARLKLSGKTRNRDLGIPEPKAGQLTLGRYLDQWLLEIKDRYRPTSWQNYAVLVRVQLKPRLGRIKLNRLHFDHLERAYTAMHKEGLSTPYIRSIHFVLSSALRQARRKNLIASDSCGLVDRNVFPYQRNRRRGLTLEELTRVFDVLDQLQELRPELTDDLFNHQHAFFTTALLSGLRFGEMAGLRWRDVELDAQILHVEQAVTRISRRHAQELGLSDLRRIGEPKTPNSVRPVELPLQAIDSLRRHKRQQQKRFLLYGRPWSEKELVFQNLRFKPAHQTNLNRAWHLIQGLAGIPTEEQIQLHGTRRTFASLETRAGNAKATEQRMGHSFAEMTRRYQNQTSQKENVRFIERTLAEARAKHGIEEGIS